MNPGHQGRDLQEKCGLADARVAPYQHQRARDDAAAQYAGELLQRQRQAIDAVGHDFCQTLGAADLTAFTSASLRLALLRGDHLFDHRTELAALWAFAEVAGGGSATVLTDEAGLDFCHLSILFVPMPAVYRRKRAGSDPIKPALTLICLNIPLSCTVGSVKTGNLECLNQRI